MACMFEPLLTIKIKIMKNLKQNLVKSILCLGVVSVSLVACQSDVNDDANIITLDQIDDQLNNLDSTLNDTTVVVEDSLINEPVDDYVEEEVSDQDVKNEEE